MIPSYITNPWKLLKDPKYISRSYFIVYAMLCIDGIVVLSVAHDSDRLHPEFTLSVLIGLMLIVGGATALWSLHKHEWFRERAGIYFIFGGLIGESLAITTEPWPIADRIYYWLFVSVMLVLINIRRHKIKGLTLDPTQGG